MSSDEQEFVDGVRETPNEAFGVSRPRGSFLWRVLLLTLWTWVAIGGGYYAGHYVRPPAPDQSLLASWLIQLMGKYGRAPGACGECEGEVVESNGWDARYSCGAVWRAVSVAGEEVRIGRLFLPEGGCQEAFEAPPGDPE